MSKCTNYRWNNLQSFTSNSWKMSIKSRFFVFSHGFLCSVNYDLMLRVQTLHHAAWRHKLRCTKNREKNTKNRDFIPIFQPFEVKLCRLFHLYLVHLDMWILLSDTHGKADDSALPSSIYNICTPPVVGRSLRKSRHAQIVPVIQKLLPEGVSRWLRGKRGQAKCGSKSPTHQRVRECTCLPG